LTQVYWHVLLWTTVYNTLLVKGMVDVLVVWNVSSQGVLYIISMQVYRSPWSSVQTVDCSMWHVWCSVLRRTRLNDGCAVCAWEGGEVAA